MAARSLPSTVSQPGPVDLDPAVLQLMLESIAMGDDSDDEGGDANAESEVPRLKAAEWLLMHAPAADRTADAAAVGASLQVETSDEDGTASGYDASADEQQPAVRPQASVPSAAAYRVISAAESRGLTESQLAKWSATMLSNDEAAPAAVDGAVTDDQEASAESEEDIGLDEHWRIHNGEAFMQAAAASSQWSRIIRQPLKRRQHVLVDLCTACGQEDAAGNNGLGSGDCARLCLDWSEVQRTVCSTFLHQRGLYTDGRW